VSDDHDKLTALQAVAKFNDMVATFTEDDFDRIEESVRMIPDPRQRAILLTILDMARQPPGSRKPAPETEADGGPGRKHYRPNMRFQATEMISTAANSVSSSRDQS
jgi:hypothetical protein